MEFKLGNLFPGLELRLTQSPHGVQQNLKAIDCTGKNNDRTLLAVEAGKIERKYGKGAQSGFHLVGNGFDVLYHHCLTKLKAGTIVNKGRVIGEAHPTIKDKKGKVTHAAHAHVAIKVKGAWDVILNYIDLKKVTIDLKPGFTSQKWKLPSTWSDKVLPSGNIRKPIPKPAPTPPPPIEPSKEVRELEKKIEKQEEKIIEKNAEINKLRVENLNLPKENLIFKIVRWVNKIAKLLDKILDKK